MADLKELREEQQKLVADARTALDEIKDDTPEERATEIESRYGTIMAEHDRLEERVKREEALEGAERETEERANTPVRDRPTEDRTARIEQPTHEQAFRAYLRGGMMVRGHRSRRGVLHPPIKARSCIGAPSSPLHHRGQRTSSPGKPAAATRTACSIQLPKPDDNT